jgi:hypothetical protein
VDEWALSRALGEPRLRALLRRLTVAERPQPGRPGAFARRTVRAYERVRGGAHTPAAAQAGNGPGNGPLGRSVLIFAPALAGALETLGVAPGGRDAAGEGFRPCRQLAPAARRTVGIYGYQQAIAAWLASDAGPLSPARAAAGRAFANLRLDPGQGKTFVAAALVALVGEPALVAVPTVALAGQFEADLARALPGARVGQYVRAKKARPSPATHDVVVVVINTLRTEPSEFTRGYGLLVLDESHELCSESNRRALWLRAPRRLGMTATPDARPDGLDRAVALFLGPPAEGGAAPGVGHELDPGQWRAEVRAVRYLAPNEYAEPVLRGGAVSAILSIARLVRDPGRVALVVAEAVRLARRHLGPDAARLGLRTEPGQPPKRHGVFVIVEHREYAAIMRDAIERALGEPVGMPEADRRPPETPEGAGGAGAGGAGAGPPPEASRSDATAAGMGRADGEQRGPEGLAGGAGAGVPPPVLMLRGGAPLDAVERARALDSHVDVMTLGFGRRGVSLRGMTALLLASPRRNGMRQIIGRIFRRGQAPGVVREIVDVVDAKSALRGQFSARKKIYQELGFPVETVTVDGRTGQIPSPRTGGGTAAAGPGSARTGGAAKATGEGTAAAGAGAGAGAGVAAGIAGIDMAGLARRLAALADQLTADAAAGGGDAEDPLGAPEDPLGAPEDPLGAPEDDSDGGGGDGAAIYQ